MIADITVTERLVATQCWNCGVHYAMPSYLREKRREDGDRFWCPNGHIAVFTETAVAKLQRKLDKEREALERSRENADFWRDQHDGSERRLSATRGVVTRIKNRISKGICPCCKRSFANLRKHMCTKHPNYAENDNDR